MKGLLVFSIFLFMCLSAIGRDNKYPVATIPEELKRSANLVYRLDQMTFTISAQSSAIERTHQVITIMNSNGKNAAIRYVAYSKLLKVNEITAAVYDANGDLIKKMRSNEIKDQSSTGSSLFSDMRVKIADLTHTSYPYTIEFESEVEYKFLFYMPNWNVIPGENVSVEKSSFMLAFPQGLEPRVKIVNSSKERSIGTLANGNTTWKWEFENVPATQTEPLGPSLGEITPKIETAPGNFEYEGYRGNMNDWKNFGLWIASLNNGRDELPQETKAKLREMTKGVTEPDEKAKILYKYLQDKTRYVSIQIGIGGQQPIEATVVDRTSYGDCKALSNYMIALLKVVGVRANYVLIKAGQDDDDIDTEFSMTQFNHAVVALPLQKDTLWLECTSQTNPFGYAGRFTGGRHALMITEQGGSIVSTPQYPQAVNRQTRTASVVIAKDGNATAKVQTKYSGLKYEEDYLSFYLDRSPDEQKKWIQETTDIPSFEIVKFHFDDIKTRIPEAIVNMEIGLRNFGSTSGKRLFVNPNLMNRSTFVPKKVENRKTPVVMKSAYIDEDDIELNFPEDLYPEFMPDPIHLESKFGSYDAQYVLESGKLKYHRKVRLEKGSFPPDTYPELIEFYRNISKADNLKLVFLSKT